MRNRADGAVARGVRTLFDVGTATGLSDGQLLERYLRRGDDSAEAAFRALVERHGPMVLRACRGVLHDVHDAEEAFQATFLILARKAGSIRKRDSIASWLFGVARRVAGRAASQRKRRAARERRGVEMAEARIPSSGYPFESDSAVQEEVDRLPERYRAPVVLCYLQGLTQEEAAIRLRLPSSTVRVRLMRARARLHDRLARRGFGPGALSGLAAGRADVLIPAPLVEETVRAAIRVAVGRAAGASGPVAALAEGVIRAMFLARLKTAMALLAALSCASLGILATIAGPSPPRTDPPDATAPQAAEKPVAPPGVGGPEVAVETVKRSRWEWTTSRLASVVPYGSVDVYPRISGYLKAVPVNIGERVKHGQLLAEIDDPGLAVAVQRAGAEVERAKARVKKAQAAIRVAKVAAKVEHARAQTADVTLKGSEGRAEYLKRVLARVKELAKQASVGPHEVDTAEDRFATAQSAAKAAESELAVVRAAGAEAEARILTAEADLLEAGSEFEVAKAGLKGATLLQESARIVAPFDGVVTRVNYHDGAFVRPPDAGKAEPIASIVREDIMLVVVILPETDVPYLDPGDPATITVPVLGANGRFRGSVLRTAYALDPTSFTLRAEIALPNPDGRLHPGLAAKAEILLDAKEDVLTIPRSALLVTNDDGSAECYCVVDGRAQRRQIRFAPSGSERIEVLDGLRDGDVVVTRPPSRLRDGQPVTIRPE